MKARAVLLCALVALALTACQERLTPDGSAYAVTWSAGTLTATNPPGGLGNERELVWGASSPATFNSGECATWESGSGAAQDGLAFRIVSSASGTNAVVLERNIWMDGFWDFVVIDFHTGGATPFTAGPSVDLSSYLGTSTTDVFPLRVCAAVVGDSLAFAVAKGTDPMPRLATPGQGGVVALTGAAASESGRTGLYVAHVPPGPLPPSER